MADKKKKRSRKKPARTFVDRVSDWAIINNNCLTSDKSSDAELLNLGKAAWQTFSRRRPLLASLCLSSAYTLAKFYDYSCITHTPKAVVNFPVIAEMVGSNDLAKALFDAIGVPLQGEPAYGDEAYDRESDKILALCIHGLGTDYTDSILGMIMLVHAALRQRTNSGQAPGCNAGEALVATLDARLKTGLTEN